MLFRGTHLTDASGSLSGVTYSHNRGGAYTRNRSIPVNPNTVQQQAVRNAFSAAQAAWSVTLTGANRSAWDSYAAATPLANALGTPVNVGGKGMFTRGYVPRVQNGFTIVAAGPSTMGLPVMTLPAITSLTASTKVAIVTFTNTDLWATAVGGALLMYSSRPQPATVNSFKGPYRLAGKVSGAGTPPTSPQNITTPFTLTAGQLVFVRFVAITADGRVSADARFSVTAV